MKNQPQIYFTPIQLKMPVETERMIEVSDPVYTFNEVTAHIDLQKYFAVNERRTGRPRYAQVKLLKVILFAFMEHGYASTRQIEKLCKTDIRFLWLLDGEKAPSHMIIDNFMNGSLNCSIDKIFQEINGYIFAAEDVDMKHVYIDGTKIIANTNRYSWVWKKSCTTNMECFQPLMNIFSKSYGFYPKYPVADAGYGSFNNYLFCEEHGMKKYMKFTMYRKECEDRKYRDDPYRAVNFRIDDGDMVCPNGRKLHYLDSRPVKGNKYGRTEELYQCEDCSNCPHRQRCFKAEGNRIVQINRELTQFHEEVIGNLNCIHGALLRMNRSIQAEGAYGGIKWNRAYTRARRRGLKSLLFETALISCGFNLHKYHLKKRNAMAAA